MHIYGAGTGNRTRAYWCIVPEKNRYATYFPKGMKAKGIPKGMKASDKFAQQIGREACLLLPHCSSLVPCTATERMLGN